MYGQVPLNLVFYKNDAKPGHRYRQIAVHEVEKFLVIVGEGDVVQTAAQFLANCDMYAMTMFPDVDSAIKDAQEEAARSVQDGWIPYRG